VLQFAHRQEGRLGANMGDRPIAMVLFQGLRTGLARLAELDGAAAVKVLAAGADGFGAIVDLMKDWQAKKAAGDEYQWDQIRQLSDRVATLEKRK
jgi:hypothetical protein